MRRTGLGRVATVALVAAIIPTKHPVGAERTDGGIVVRGQAEATGELEPTEMSDSSEADACAVLRDGLLVEVEGRLLHLCREGRTDASYPVNLGKGGSGKSKQGDKKTPLGRYELAPPRASSSGFTWFVPIGYPTKAQRKAGFTGGAIGIHGPPDWMPKWVIDLAFSMPWTDGCIMVRTKEEIDAIRGWLLENDARVIEIR